MGIRHSTNDPKDDYKDGQDQKQDPDNKQAQLQGEAQGQLQGQAQAQGQGQFQLAVQELKSHSENSNDNTNDNQNTNDNTNHVDNAVTDQVDNCVDNCVDNHVLNTVENAVTNNVDVGVNVHLDLGLDSLPSDNDLIDIDQLHAENLSGALVNFANDIYQDVHGAGNDNAFNIQQVNTLVDNDSISNPTVSYAADGYDPSSVRIDSWHHDPSGFSMVAHADGGHTEVGNISQHAPDSGSITGGNSSADAMISQEAFTQNIVQGANIQFNSADITVAGHDVMDHVDVLPV
jgi:hypothetical protein